MKKIKKIKLSNIEKSQLEKDQLLNLKGGSCGYGNPCYVGCNTGCVGAVGHMDQNSSASDDRSQWVWG